MKHFQAFMISMVKAAVFAFGLYNVSNMALTADNTKVSRKELGIKSYPVLTGVTIYKHAIVALTAAGFLHPNTGVAGEQIVGIADEKVVSGASASGTFQCKVLSEYEFLLTASGMTQANVGQPCFAADDLTVTLTSAAGLPVGQVVEYVSATSVWVHVSLASENPAFYFGAGAPGITAPKGSLYVRTDGSSVSTRLYVNTDGATTWTNVTTAA